jgi:hypothetical protein
MKLKPWVSPRQLFLYLRRRASAGKARTLKAGRGEGKQPQTAGYTDHPAEDRARAKMTLATQQNARPVRQGRPASRPRTGARSAARRRCHRSRGGILLVAEGVELGEVVDVLRAVLVSGPEAHCCRADRHRTARPAISPRPKASGG